MKYKIFDRVINFHIDNGLLERLDFYAKQKEWRRNFVIREAIKEYLEKRKNEGQDQRFREMQFKP